MFYPLIFMLVFLSDGHFHATAYSTQIGTNSLEQCASQLQQMRRFVVMAGAEKTIMKQACWTKQEWISYLGRDPWAKIPRGKKPAIRLPN